MSRRVTAAPFHGSPPPTEEMPVVLAGKDERVDAAWPVFETALEQAGVRFSLYQPTQHGFNNDTTPRHDGKAAHEAWKRMLALFERRLRKAQASSPESKRIARPMSAGVAASTVGAVHLRQIRDGRCAKRQLGRARRRRRGCAVGRGDRLRSPE